LILCRTLCAHDRPLRGTTYCWQDDKS